MKNAVRHSAGRAGTRRGSRLAAAVLTVAALTSGAGAAASLTPAWAAGPRAVAADQADPLHCPSAACRRVSQDVGYPDSVTLDGKGNAYVTDYWYGRLFQVDLNSGKSTEVTDGISYATGVAVDGRTAYVASHDTGNLWEVNLDTGHKDEVATGIDSQVENLALDGHGSAYLTSQGSGKLWKIDLRTGAKSEVASEVPHADGLALDPARNTAYVSTDSGGKLWAVDLSTGRKYEVATGLGRAEDVAINAAGTKAYVVGYDSNKVVEIDLETGRKTDVVTGLGKPDGITLDAAGNAYIADYDGVLWKVRNLGGSGAQPGPPAPPTPPAPGGSAVKQVDGVTAEPGDKAVPKVTVTNNTGDRIGRQDVTLTLGPGGLKWLEHHKLYTSRDGGKEEFGCDLVEDDPKQVLCKGVNLNLAPGETVELRTVVGTMASLKPCEVPRVNFKVGDVGAADANFVMKDREGRPETCPERP
ncbi:hypothetical protein AB0H82_06750 [Streptomyces sp. NPDC050732]|uniref:Vgb family protein n=1 Tax=Streptomyces sp. NPDC050732 TaxID=3154632 RepID=UPI003420CC81